MKQSAGHAADPLQQAIDDLLRKIPERWVDFEHDDLSSTEHRAIFLLVAAGLVERRIGLCVCFAGQPKPIEFAIDASGEYGLVEAIDAVVSEMWTRWGPAFEAWKASEAKGSTPFRVTSSGLNRWRLTDQGVIARGDLDIHEPTSGAAKEVGSHLEVFHFVTRTGPYASRPGIRGAGRLVGLNDPDRSSGITAEAIPVKVVNSQEIAATFCDLVVPEITKSIEKVDFGSSAAASKQKPSGAVQPGMSIQEAIAKAESHVKDHRGVFPGRNKLARIVGCSQSQMTKAINRSSYLKARRAEHNATQRGANRERQVSQPLDELAHDPDWKSKEGDRDSMLDQLAAEQQDDLDRQVAQSTRARRRKSP